MKDEGGKFLQHVGQEIIDAIRPHYLISGPLQEALIGPRVCELEQLHFLRQPTSEVLFTEPLRELP